METAAGHVPLSSVDTEHSCYTVMTCRSFQTPLKNVLYAQKNVSH